MTGSWRRVGAGLLVLALGACAQLPGVKWPALGSSAPAASATKAATPIVRKTALKRYVEIVSPKVSHAPPFLGVPRTNFYLLRTWIDRQTGDATTQLYVSDSYAGSERGYAAAYDAAGRPLPFVSILRDQITCGNGCSWAEEFAATLPESALTSDPQAFAVTFAAPSGVKTTIRLSPALVKSQLAAIAAERARLRHAAGTVGEKPPRESRVTYPAPRQRLG